jgi:hypothetical protein
MTYTPSPNEILSEQIAKNAGLDWHQLPLPYMAAVAATLRARGIGVDSYHANPDDPRSGAVILDHALPGDSELALIWSADGAWDYVQCRGPHDEGYAHAPLGYVATLALPEQIADAVAELTGLPYQPDPAALARIAPWQAPADYDPEPELTEPDDASPELDRGLAAYVTHPGYLDHAGARPSHDED